MTPIQWKDRTLVEKICLVFREILLAATFVALVIEGFVLNVMPIWCWFFMNWGYFLGCIANRRAQPASIWTTVQFVFFGVMAGLYTVLFVLRFL